MKKKVKTCEAMNVLAFLGGIATILYTGFDIVINNKPFNAIEFGTGLGIVISLTGAGKGAVLAGQAFKGRK